MRFNHLEPKAVAAALRVGLAFYFVCQTCVAQQAAITRAAEPQHAVVETPKVAAAAPLPSYLLCRHFLAWTLALDKDALRKKLTNPFAFAAPFAKSLQFSNDDLTLLRSEAASLDRDISAVDSEAKLLIESFRAQARLQVKRGKPLPPAPAGLQLLQQKKTAVTITHYLQLKDKLGQTLSARLDAFLNRDFAQHVKVRPVNEAARVSTEPGAFVPR